MSRKKLRNAIFTAMDALRGILIVSFVDRDLVEARRRWDRACVDLRVVFDAALAAS
jgi:hypothetical protein